jgi:hypothetical protein
MGADDGKYGGGDGKIYCINGSLWTALVATFMYMESCVFECEDFPKENQKLANKATHIG